MNKLHNSQIISNHSHFDKFQRGKAFNMVWWHHFEFDNLMGYHNGTNDNRQHSILHMLHSWKSFWRRQVLYKTECILLLSILQTSPWGGSKAISRWQSEMVMRIWWHSFWYFCDISTCDKSRDLWRGVRLKEHGNQKDEKLKLSGHFGRELNQT